MSICQGLIEDQDISGVGVRVTFYAQSFLAVLASALPDSDITGSFWALTLTTFSLLISALIEATKNNLSLYNAMLVSYLCTLHVLASESLIFMLKMFLVNPLRSKMTRMHIATILQSLGSTIFGCIIWQRAKTFGSQPECNADTKLLFFGKSESATQLGGQIGIGWLGSICMPTLFKIFRLRKERVDDAPDTTEDATKNRLVAGFLGIFFLLPIWLYIVITMELTIQRNPVIHGPTEFGFGQVFPLISIAVPLYAVLSGIF